MIQRLDFVYNNISSVDMGVIQVNLDSDLFRETFIAPKRINEISIRGREKPYFLGVERETISFPLTLVFKDGFNEDKIRAVANWLDQDFYKPFYFLDNPNKILYAMVTENSEFIHNGISDGYITLNFKCNSPYAYSPLINQLYDFTNNTSNGTSIKIINNGDLECKPIIVIESLTNNNNITIVNNTNNIIFSFTNLNQGEIVVVDNEAETIESSLSYVWRYDNFNGNFLKLALGINTLTVYGVCKLTFKYQFKYKTIF